MPRANRFHLPGYVWHLTHRCHRGDFLLKFARDRRLWVSWLFEARKRFDLRVLNYQVTSNHVHLVVRDRDQDEIANSMQLLRSTREPSKPYLNLARSIHKFRECNV